MPPFRTTAAILWMIVVSCLWPARASAGDGPVRSIGRVAASAPAAGSGTLQGTVTDVLGDPLAGVTVQLLHRPIPPQRTDGSGFYRFSDVPADTGYVAIFGLLPTYGAASAFFSIPPGGTVVEDAALPFAQTFEDGTGGYTGSDPWQWGTPSVVGPGGAFSGTKCWGTNLTGDYPNDSHAYLTSPVLDPTGLPYLSLSFTHYYDTQAGFDGGNVQVNNGFGWITVTPAGGYPNASLPALGGEPGWSGFSGGWQPAVFDLSAYSHSHLTIRFQFGSDGAINGPGWYIDDVSIYVYSGLPTGLTQAAGPIPTRAAVRLVPACPNPFRDESWVRLRVPAGGSLRVTDAEGRIIRTLLQEAPASGEEAVRWDGRDESGRPVPAGTYFLFLEARGEVRGRSIVKVR